MAFKKATKHESKLRLALIGPAGAGKTYSALSVASGLGGRIAVLDSEHGSASKYADLFEFDVIEPETFSPQVYIDAMLEAERAGYGVIVLDSLSHAWAGKGGALEMVDAASRRAKGNKFVAWGDVTPLQQAMVDTILTANIHVIATIRSKMEYAQDLDSEGRKVVRKLGMQPVQRDQLEYEFDLVGDLDNENTMTVTKSRIPALSGAVIRKPGKQLAESLLGWLAGVQREPRPAETRAEQPQPQHAAVSQTGPSTSVSQPTHVVSAQQDSAAALTKFFDSEPKQAPAATKPVAPTTAPTSPKTNGSPRAPEAVRKALVETAKKTTGEPKGLMLQNAVLSLNTLVGGDETKRESLTEFFFGKPTAGLLSAGECLALMTWIDVRTVDGKKAPAPMAIQESNAILATVAEMAA